MAGGDYSVATCGGYGDCGDCGVAPCRNRPILRGLGHLFGCGSGCGEVYYDEWCNDPPACCDPCDSCGNFAGGGGCGCGWWNPLAGLANLWGYRYAPMGGCCGESYGGQMMMGEAYGAPMMMDEMEMIPADSLAPADTAPSVLPKLPKPAETPQATGRHARPRFTTAGTHRTLRR